MRIIIGYNTRILSCIAGCLFVQIHYRDTERPYLCIAFNRHTGIICYHLTKSRPFIVEDAELKKSKDGNSQFIAFRVAVNEKKGDDTRTTYYDVTHPTTGVFHFLKKGRTVCVMGPLSIWQSNGQDGKTYLNAHISAKLIDLVDSKEK